MSTPSSIQCMGSACTQLASHSHTHKLREGACVCMCVFVCVEECREKGVSECLPKDGEFHSACRARL